MQREADGWIGELDSAIDTLEGEALGDLPDARIEQDFAALHRRVERLEAERLRRLGHVERRGSYARDGHLSAAAWLASTLKVAWGTAREHVRIARGLEAMPETHRALTAGDVSLSDVRVLVAARETDPVAFERSEGQLVNAARMHSVRDFQRVAAFWRERIAREALHPEDGLRARRRLHASVSFAGMVRIDGDLDPETGETVLTALGAVVDAGVHSGDRTGTRTPAQRRADALGEICRQYLDRPDRPSVAGERPHLTVTVDASDLARGGALGDSETNRRTGAGELDHVGPVSAETARRLSCDASVMRVVLRAPSEPLDIGRRTPVVPFALRRAVVVRDGGCRFPECDRPHTWCDAHHVVHWADGGATRLSNLLLLCRRHHRKVHDGFAVEMREHGPVFRRPDGSVLEDRAPPDR